ncbi:Phenylpropionate dioxygenase, large terminal subunit [Sphingobium faniae]|nr:Phenylpropionate dioxygenase, large terminal subunit [Sphingobium faniae]
MKSFGDLVQEDRVHGSVYLDPAIFEREMEAIFAATWVYVGHEGEIPRPGDFRLRAIGRQPVIFVRDHEGAVRVLMNRCTHRGNAVCVAERGNADGFTCAYHGWRFRLNGDLAAVPYGDRYDEAFDRSTLGLRPAARVENYRGLVFASLRSEGSSLREHLGAGVLAELDDLTDMSPDGDLDVRAGVHKTVYDGNWKLQLENSMDGYHPNFVHRSHFDNIRARTGNDPRVHATSRTQAHLYDLGNGHASWHNTGLMRSGSQSNPAIAMGEGPVREYADALMARHGEERGRHLLAKGSVHLMIFPNVIFIGSHIRMIQPISVDRTEVYLLPVLLKGAPRALNTRRLRAHEAFYGPAGAGAPDDVEIFRRVQHGLRAGGDPWVLLSRGATMEQQGGNGYAMGQITDEIAQRAIWRQWRTMMEAEAIMPRLEAVS